LITAVCEREGSFAEENAFIGPSGSRKPFLKLFSQFVMLHMSFENAGIADGAVPYLKERVDSIC